MFLCIDFTLKVLATATPPTRQKSNWDYDDSFPFVYAALSAFEPVRALSTPPKLGVKRESVFVSSL